MHSLLSQQSIVTYCKLRDIIAHGAALPRLLMYYSLDTKMKNDFLSELII